MLFVLNLSKSRFYKIANTCTSVTYGHEKRATKLWPFSDPDATRTHDRLLRRQMLYPAELPDHHSVSGGWDGGWFLPHSSRLSEMLHANGCAKVDIFYVICKYAFSYYTPFSCKTLQITPSSRCFHHFSCKIIRFWLTLTRPVWQKTFRYQSLHFATAVITCNYSADTLRR